MNIPEGYKLLGIGEEGKALSTNSCSFTYYEKQNLVIIAKNQTENNQKYELPETGGIGTNRFTAVGLALMTGSLMCGYVFNKLIKKENIYKKKVRNMNMKKMKKVMALLLSVIMILAMSATVFAAQTKITITGGDNGSEYSAYRLLNLTTSTTGTGENEKTNYSYTLNSKYESVLKSVTGKTTEKDILSYISSLDAAGIRTFADTVYQNVKNMSADYTTKNDEFSVDQGYYLITETKVGTTGKPAQTGSVSLVMLDTAGNKDISVKTKKDVPEVVKKVKDVNDSTGEKSGWQDSADADIGDEIEYQLTGTVSEKIGDYKGYYYEFVDTMTHLTYVNNSAEVTVNGKVCTNDFEINWDTAKKVLTVKIADLKTILGVNKDSKVVVTYKAKLDDNAVVGSEGNPNTVYLKYANNPYQNGDGTNDTGKTPTDKNIVFTYKVLADKVDENGNALKGAKFELFKQNEDSTWKSLGEQAGTGTDENKFAWSGLDDGIYKLVENKVPDGYNKLDDQIFTVTGTHDSESDDPKLTDLTGNVTTGTITFDKDY